MNIKGLLVMIAMVCGALTACASDIEPESEQNNDMESYKINITIDGKTMTATLVENSSAAALVERLRQGEVTYSADDYGGFEKVGDLGFSLPQNNKQVTTKPGDIILYMGRNLCLYYAQNSWNFTPIGRIDFSSESELRDFLKAGKGDITVTLSLTDNSGVSSIVAPENRKGKAYRPDGIPAGPNAKGVIIRDGKKTYRK